MNPENIDPMVAQKESFISPLCKVTPLSKYLALAVFIVLPFIGGLIGYQLLPKQIVQMPVSVTEKSIEHIAPAADAHILSNYAKSPGNIGSKGFPTALSLVPIAKSNDDKKVYYVSLPYEGYSYSQLLYTEAFELSRPNVPSVQENLGIYAVGGSSLFINPEKSNIYYSATSSVYWQASDDNKYLAVVSPDEHALSYVVVHI